jgi:large subunit ribosomal protein L15
MEIHDLRPNKGAKKKRKRVGRGIAAGQGKTAGRGTKGQGARSGGGKGVYFEGGQLPLARRLPYKRGFTNINKIYYRPINVATLATFAADTEVNPDLLAARGLIKKASNPIVILGEGDLTVALTVVAHRVSAAAREKIEAAGGTVTLISVGSD